MIELHEGAVDDLEQAALPRTVRRLALRRFPLSVVYTHRDGDTLVLAVAHGRRRPGYWHERT